MDIKAPFEKERYREVTKTDHLEKVLKSLDLLLQAGIDFECRTTCDPRLLKPADLKKMAEDLYAKGVKNTSSSNTARFPPTPLPQMPIAREYLPTKG